MARIKTPVPGFTGLVAGVSFVSGEGSTNDKAALAYFARQGYEVTAGRKAPAKAPKADSKPADAGEPADSDDS